MMRRVHLTILFVAAMLAFAPGAHGQVRLGAHGAWAADVFGGSWGAGASLEVGFPVLPLDILVAGEYFFPDCGTADGCGYLGGSADLHLHLPLPVISPYLTGGVVYRSLKVGDGADAVADTGWGLGAGLDLGALVLGAYAEARYEYIDTDEQVVFRVGLRF